eukprot:g5462.t1
MSTAEKGSMRILDPKVDPAYKDQLQQLREMCAKAFASFERKLGPGPVVNILIKWELDEVKAMKELGDIVEQNKAARRQKMLEKRGGLSAFTPQSFVAEKKTFESSPTKRRRNVSRGKKGRIQMSDSESDVESDVKTAAPAKRAATAKRRRISPLDADSSSSEEAEVSEESEEEEEEEELDLADDDDESGEEATSLKPAVRTGPRRRSSRLRTIAKPKYVYDDDSSDEEFEPSNMSAEAASREDERKRTMLAKRETASDREFIVDDDDVEESDYGGEDAEVEADVAKNKEEEEEEVEEKGKGNSVAGSTPETQDFCKAPETDVQDEKVVGGSSLMPAPSGIPESDAQEKKKTSTGGDVQKQDAPTKVESQSLPKQASSMEAKKKVSIKAAAKAWGSIFKSSVKRKKP